ncbi:MAG: rRNA maturation RNase YbeY [Bryobacterales bacterium]|nr:rRNA maturation RNase YbeY [Bryobacteraceae bacterium]MDW8354668.1 rRNA maturation RNase YbeY [Bryobacterales bacterium]
MGDRDAASLIASPMSATEDPLIFRGRRRLPRRALAAFARRLEETVAGGQRFTCLLATDRELRDLNRRFLGRDEPTDVLSFPQPGQTGWLGEIAISVDRAAEQAARFGHSVAEEIQILMLHGVLHLLGMDHETDRGRMARVERAWRKRLGLPQALTERRDV